jgi:transaldolase
MKFFIDTANLEEIREAMRMGIIDGITTNPSLVAKEKKDNKFDPKKHMREIFDIMGVLPVSVEVLSLTKQAMIDEAIELAAIETKNYATSYAISTVIKIPATEEGLKAVKSLTDRKLKTNVTLIFSATQALLAAKAGATYVSPFVGRLDDISQCGMDLVRDILTIYRNYDIKTEVIVASIRNPMHVVEAAKIGAHVSTIPFKVIKQLMKHPLTDKGIEAFSKDWEKVK